MNKLVHIPRYLGLRDISRRGRFFNLDFGYTKRLKSRVRLDEAGLERVMKSIRIRKDDEKKGRSRKTPAHFERYDRHLLFYGLAGAEPVSVQERLSKSTVALIGMGGIGNWVSLGLIGSGLKCLKLIDFDQIELSNLTRQVLFNESDIGKPKVQIAAERLGPKNHQTEVIPILENVRDSRSLALHLKGVDFVIISADRPAEIHDWVDEVCVREKIPYLNIGYRDGEGVVGPMTVPGVTSCYQCFKPALGKAQTGGVPKKTWEQEVIQAFEDRYQAPSFGPLNGLVSAIGVLEVLKFLGGFGEQDVLDTELRVDPLKLSIKKTRYRRDRGCWHCS